MGYRKKYMKLGGTCVGEYIGGARGENKGRDDQISLYNIKIKKNY